MQTLLAVTFPWIIRGLPVWKICNAASLSFLGEYKNLSTPFKNNKEIINLVYSLNSTVNLFLITVKKQCAY